MTPIRFVVRQPVGPISGRRGHLADEGRARCAVSLVRPHDAEAFSLSQQPGGHRLAAAAVPQQVQTAVAGLDACARGLDGRVFALERCRRRTLHRFEGDKWGRWGHRASVELFSASVTWGQAGDTGGQAAAAATTRSATGAPPPPPACPRLSPRRAGRVGTRKPAWMLASPLSPLVPALSRQVAPARRSRASFGGRPPLR